MFSFSREKEIQKAKSMSPQEQLSLVGEWLMSVVPKEYGMSYNIPTNDSIILSFDKKVDLTHKVKTSAERAQENREFIGRGKDVKKKPQTLVIVSFVKIL